MAEPRGPEAQIVASVTKPPHEVLVDLLEEAEADVRGGRVHPAREVLAELRSEPGGRDSRR